MYPANTIPKVATKSQVDNFMSSIYIKVSLKLEPILYSTLDWLLFCKNCPIQKAGFLAFGLWSHKPPKVRFS